jgi:glycosyltransferase involved in cell wall biosynthesis
MKIAFLSSHFPPDFIGGGEWSTKMIAEGMAALGHDVHVFCGAEKDMEEKINGITIERVSALHGLWDKPLFEKRKSSIMAKRLKEYLGKEFDVVHAHDFRSALALSMLDLDNSFVTVRDFAPICGTTNNMLFNGKSCNGCYWRNVLLKCHRVKEASLPRKPFRVWQYKYNLDFRNHAYEKITRHVYISNALKNRVASRMSLPKNSVVIPNPVGREWLGGVIDFPIAKNIVYAGTVEQYKGIGVLLEAFAKLRKDISDVKLTIIGSGHVENYRRFAESVGVDSAVNWTGKLPQDKVREYFDQAFVIVQPSIWEEPFGRTVIEAYARGRAVVASNIGGLKETFAEGTGALVAPGNVNELYLALKKIISDRENAQKMGTLARSYVEQNFTAENIAKRYLDFYEHTYRS